jgi:F0F1-type ATP synthase membrane subunit c/vacuolar-type H+-ATPase subunit K
MKLACRALLVLILVLFVSPSAFALTADEVKQQVEISRAANPGTSGAGIGMGLAIVGAGIGLGLIGFSALSGIARQPEQAGKIQGVMYVLAALVEGAAIIALLLCFLVAARIM